MLELRRTRYYRLWADDEGSIHLHLVRSWDGPADHLELSKSEAELIANEVQQRLYDGGGTLSPHRRGWGYTPEYREEPIQARRR